METLHSSHSLLDRLLAGEQVECLECQHGHYQPFNPEAEINHSFICDNCGSHYHWDPAVFVE